MGVPVWDNDFISLGYITWSGIDESYVGLLSECCRQHCLDVHANKSYAERLQGMVLVSLEPFFYALCHHLPCQAMGYSLSLHYFIYSSQQEYELGTLINPMLQIED